MNPSVVYDLMPVHGGEYPAVEMESDLGDGREEESTYTIGVLRVVNNVLEIVSEYFYLYDRETDRFSFLQETVLVGEWVVNPLYRRFRFRFLPPHQRGTSSPLEAFLDDVLDDMGESSIDMRNHLKSGWLYRFDTIL